MRESWPSMGGKLEAYCAGENRGVLSLVGSSLAFLAQLKIRSKRGGKDLIDMCQPCDNYIPTI